MRNCFKFDEFPKLSSFLFIFPLFPPISPINNISSLPSCFDESPPNSAAFVWIGGQKLLNRNSVKEIERKCACQNGTFSIEFFETVLTGDVDDNFWNAHFLSIQIYSCPQFCICDERGECFERAKGSEPIGHAEMYPFCDGGGCHLYFLFESANLNDCLLIGHRGTRLNDSVQFKEGKWGSPFPLGANSPFLKARAAGCAGCEFVLKNKEFLKGKCLF